MKDRLYERYTLYTIFLVVSFGTCVPIRNCPKRCKCKYAIINKGSLEVNCAGVGIHAMPHTLPPAQTYRLLFSRNNITKLEPRSYLQDTDYLDLSYNAIGDIQSNALPMLNAHLRYLYLHGNKLRCLPEQIQQVDLSHVHDLSLYENPWQCDCVDLWMRAWIEIHSPIIQRHAISCGHEDIEVAHSAQKQRRHCMMNSQTKQSSTTEIKRDQLLFAFIVFLVLVALVYCALFIIYRHQLYKIKKKTQTVETEALV